MAQDIDRPTGMTASVGGGGTSQSKEAARIGRVRTGRRRFLTGVGATGLAVAAATFGRPTGAFAVTEVCCDLYHGPGSDCYTSYPTCSTMASPYIWTCMQRKPRVLMCHCCEAPIPKSKLDCSPKYKSAYTCAPPS
jgi:hypothetical protein